ncbi:hypothetical protein QUF50_10545, partial [Thiotrichales bacterium HSG1]|nr:hypothetical protein [Thiotrichales bacterium HSG1]
MSILKSLLFGIILLSCSAQALQLNLESTDAGTRIMVSNDQDLHNVDVYLVSANLDSNSFKSLTESAKWQANLSPTYSDIDVPPFESFKAANLDESCPEKQRCFLALVAVKTGTDPI